MASIKTSIELYDNFSDPMMDIVNAANAGTIAIERTIRDECGRRYERY
jgi:hypothetical protein